MKIQLETDKVLQTMADTFRDRNKKYGNNYSAVGDILATLFPEGITLKTPEDFCRFHFMDWMVGKLTRFSRTGMTDVDSVHDLAVYSAMMEDLITQLKEDEEPEAEDDKQG